MIFSKPPNLIEANISRFTVPLCLVIRLESYLYHTIRYQATLIMLIYANYMLQAEEITLSIGQAFDLAYKKFLDSSSKDMDMKKQYLLLQKKVHILHYLL